MPRTKRQQSVRINLEVNPSVRDRLERLKNSTEAESLTEVIRRALATYEALVDLSPDKHKILVRLANDQHVTLLLVP